MKAHAYACIQMSGSNLIEGILCGYKCI